MHFCSRTAQDVKAANERCVQEVPDAKAIGNVVDVTNKERLAQWVRDCAKESSRIDVVVANVSSLSNEVSCVAGVESNCIRRDGANNSNDVEHRGELADGVPDGYDGDVHYD